MKRDMAVIAIPLAAPLWSWSTALFCRRNKLVMMEVARTFFATDVQFSTVERLSPVNMAVKGKLDKRGIDKTPLMRATMMGPRSLSIPTGIVWKMRRPAPEIARTVPTSSVV